MARRSWFSGRSGNPPASPEAEPEVEQAPEIKEKIRTASRLETGGELEPALKAYHDVLRERPKHRGALVAYARILGRMGRWADAAEAWEQAADAYPMNSSYRLLHANALLKAGRARDALIEYLDVLGSSPQEVRALRAVALIMTRMKRWGGAVAALSELVRLHPEDLKFRSWLARIHFSRQDYSSSAAEYRAILERDARNDEALAGLGRCLVRQKEWDEAQSIWQRLHQGRAGAVEPLIQLARISTAQGQSGQGIHYLDRALAIEPSNSNAIALRETMMRQAPA